MSAEQRERDSRQQEFVYKERLPNGFGVLVHEMPWAQSVTARLLVKAGPRYENGTTVGSAHFLEHMFGEGSKRYSSRIEVDRAIESRGGDFIARTDKEHALYQAKLPAESAGFATEFLREVVFNPTMTKEAVEREKKLISLELGESIDSPDEHLLNILRKHVWKDHPLGNNTLGTFESIEGTTRQGLLNYFNQFYTPDNMFLVVAGNITARRAIDMAANDFGDLSPSVDKLPVVPPPSQSVESRVLIEERDMKLAHLLLAFDTMGHGESSPMLPQIQILSRLLRSNIFHKFIDLGLAYSITCGNLLVSDSGHIVIAVKVAPKNTQEAVTKMVQEVNHLNINGMTVQEAKDGVVSDVFLNLDDTNHCAHYIGEQELYTGNVKTPEKMEAEIQAVSVEDIKRMKESILTGGNSVLVVLGPVSKLRRL